MKNSQPATFLRLCYFKKFKKSVSINNCQFIIFINLRVPRGLMLFFLQADR